MARTRNSITHKALRAIRQPGLIGKYAHRVRRNRRIRRTTSSHPEFYRWVMADDVARRTANGAVGTESAAKWEKIGRKQFRYLRNHGLKRSSDLLEIGCGNLRAGRHFIKFLGVDQYTGVDISPEILLAAHETIVADGLQDKRPRLFLVSGTSLDFLPAASIDVAHAHSVFSHTPLEVIESYLEAVHRLLRPGGFFDFTYHHTDSEPWDFLEEDYYYPTRLLIEKARTAGFAGERLDDWVYSQAKIRLTKV